jgi:hypothetical protein
VSPVTVRLLSHDEGREEQTDTVAVDFSAVTELSP